MKNQAQLDAATINQLRDQMSVTGNATMNKLHSIVAKHEIQQPAPGAHSQNATNAFNRKAQEELTRKLAEKDQLIQKLQAGREGASQQQETNLKKNAELRNEIASLKDDLKRERERVDIKAANKKLLRLQKERTEQDKVIANLRKAIDGFGERMLKYESEKVHMEDKSEAQMRKEMLEQ